MTKGLDIDAVYFLMFPGWEKEFRSNRWHYASRWAKHASVVLVQGADYKDWGSVYEDRIPNCRILRVFDVGDSARDAADFFTQAQQINSDIQLHGYKKVMLWMYNPHYFMSWNLIPAAVRVYHATENHFQYPNISVFFKERLQSVLNTADAVICCSEGVFNTYKEYTPGKAKTISNGCEFDVYATGTRYQALEEKAEGYEKRVVYAGNIDDRLNYPALLDAAEKNKSYFFAFWGQVNILEPENRQIWKKIKERGNVHFFGFISPEFLPDVYKSADVGILPYRLMPLLKKNTFPLKAFEMLASGLPIVAVNLDMLLPYVCKGICVTATDEDFLSGIQGVSRDTLRDEDTNHIIELASLQDYDAKFALAYDLVHDIASKNTNMTSLYKDKLGMVLSRKTQTKSEVSNKLRLFDKVFGPFLRLLVKLFRPIILFIYQVVWPKMPEKVRMPLRNTLYDFVTKVMKL